MSMQQLTQEQATVGLKTAVRIIRGWQASPGQACKILRISRSTLRRAEEDKRTPFSLDVDQLQRIGLILGIHASLRTVFANQANVTSFPGLPNDNAFFDGRPPLDVMAQGDLISLYETYKRIDQLKHVGEG
ncbi:antitoxin Xre-like helix-turn-helix domain-containing protein [Pseudomonas maumuensis]|uniref:Antitoxin Xre-like helix-turn-helix domain-containing protein n=1 Tax=Pseudomonas maumuensis TaxID=2842354 RepID=A0ABX8NKU6_9PSED|nr:antitoxin Xre-like helix-turn-helix domain-containing protein [Pseudomonas maumuensis]QXH56607.1 hypothetical protein KSS90_25410 [Pseudomonas maumuensis]